MKLAYKFEKTPILEGIHLEVENQGTELVYSLDGPGSELLGPTLEEYFAWLNGMGPLADLGGSNIYSLYLPPIPSQAHVRMLEGFIQTMGFNNPTPQAVTIAITNQCQCNCFHCSAFRRGNAKELLSAEDIKRTVEQCLDLGVTNVTFTGGEPLMRDDLAGLLQSVDKTKALVQVFTNGFLLDRAMARKLKADGTDCVQISLDSPHQAEHDRLRGQTGLFKAVKRAVKSSLDAGLLTGLSTYATNDSLKSGELRQIVDLAKKWGVHEVSVFDVIPSGRLLERADMMLSPNCRRILQKEGNRINSEKGARPRLISQTWTNSGEGFSKHLGCLAGHFQLHITAFGDLTPCDFVPLSFGNVKETALADIWKKLTSHEAFCQHRMDCRMQSPDFRSRYIDPIVKRTDLPVPIEEVQAKAG